MTPALRPGESLRPIEWAAEPDLREHLSPSDLLLLAGDAGGAVRVKVLRVRDRGTMLVEYAGGTTGFVVDAGPRILGVIERTEAAA